LKDNIKIDFKVIIWENVGLDSFDSGWGLLAIFIEEDEFLDQLRSQEDPITWCWLVK
jgi:hypothetical protein